MLPLRTAARATAAWALAAAVAGAQTTGSADFSRYVALGDSLTAAFVSGALHLDAQIVSYPQLIDLQATGALDFEQPLVSDPGLPPVAVLTSLDPVLIVTKPGFGVPINFLLERPYDNLAVPGADAAEVLSLRTDNGGLNDLVLRGGGSQVEQAVRLGATFVTVWAGNNDALGAALSGIVIDDQTLTTTPRFEAAYRGILGALGAGGVGGFALATIPDVTAIPFVSTLPRVVVDPATNEPVLVGGRPVPLLGPDGPLGPGDFVLLTATTFLARGDGIPAALGGTGRPLPDRAVLSAAEVARIRGRVGEFNRIIGELADEVGGALVDTAGLFDEIDARGLSLGGIEYTTEFLTGGLFSLDGVHPLQMGYALVANAFIEAINDTYGASIPLVGLGDFAFSELGLAPGLRETPLGAGQLVYSKRAYKHLRRALDIPSPKKLDRLKRKLSRSAR